MHPADARAGAEYEHITIGGDAYFVKRLSPASDWIMRVTGDRVHRPYLVWQAGIMDRAPGCIDHTVVAMEVDGTGDQAVLTMLMRDVGSFLVPPGDTVVPAGQHENFIAHMAALSAAFWGWQDDIGLTTMTQRLRFFAPDNIAAELAAADVPGPIAAAAAGWDALPERSPLLSNLARLIHARPEVVTGQLAGTPATFLHGDWKMGNLGSHPDGRTILLDWAYPGAGPACWDLPLSRHPTTASAPTASTTPGSSPSATTQSSTTSASAAPTPEPASFSSSRTWTSASSTPPPASSSANSSSTPTATTSPPAAHQAGQRKTPRTLCRFAVSSMS